MSRPLERHLRRFVLAAVIDDNDLKPMTSIGGSSTGRHPTRRLRGKPIIANVIAVANYDFDRHLG